MMFNFQKNFESSMLKYFADLERGISQFFNRGRLKLRIWDFVVISTIAVLLGLTPRSQTVAQILSRSRAVETSPIPTSQHRPYKQ